jgi:hypothetical protein
VELARSWVVIEVGLAFIFLLLNVMHGDRCLGRKVYLAASVNIATHPQVSEV